MPDVTQYSFSYQEVVTALLKQQRIHQGLWQLTVNLGFSAANVGESNNSLSPAAVVQIVAIGIQQASQQNNLTVDAAKANPV